MLLNLSRSLTARILPKCSTGHTQLCEVSRPLRVYCGTSAKEVMPCETPRKKDSCLQRNPAVRFHPCQLDTDRLSGVGPPCGMWGCSVSRTPSKHANTASSWKYNRGTSSGNKTPNSDFGMRCVQGAKAPCSPSHTPCLLVCKPASERERERERDDTTNLMQHTSPPPNRNSQHQPTTAGPPQQPHTNTATEQHHAKYRQHATT